MNTVKLEQKLIFYGVFTLNLVLLSLPWADIG